MIVDKKDYYILVLTDIFGCSVTKLYYNNTNSFIGIHDGVQTLDYMLDFFNGVCQVLNLNHNYTEGQENRISAQDSRNEVSICL